MSVAGSSWDHTSRRIARRRGSARALSGASTRARLRGDLRKRQLRYRRPWQPPLQLALGLRRVEVQNHSGVARGGRSGDRGRTRAAGRRCLAHRRPRPCPNLGRRRSRRHPQSVVRMRRVATVRLRCDNGSYRRPPACRPLGTCGSRQRAAGRRPGRGGAPRRLAAAPSYAPSTLVPVVSHGPGLLVGMRLRFRYRLDPQAASRWWPTTARPPTTWSATWSSC
jgi:hypothetical protein